MSDDDYIVVGAASAGCAIAARLSEDPSVDVLLPEAGGTDDDQRISTPHRAWEAALVLPPTTETRRLNKCHRSLTTD